MWVIPPQPLLEQWDLTPPADRGHDVDLGGTERDVDVDDGAVEPELVELLRRQVLAAAEGAEAADERDLAEETGVVASTRATRAAAGFTALREV